MGQDRAHFHDNWRKGLNCERDITPRLWLSRLVPNQTSNTRQGNTRARNKRSRRGRAARHNRTHPRNTRHAARVHCPGCTGVEESKKGRKKAPKVSPGLASIMWPCIFIPLYDNDVFHGTITIQDSRIVDRQSSSSFHINIYTMNNSFFVVVGQNKYSTSKMFQRSTQGVRTSVRRDTARGRCQYCVYVDLLWTVLTCTQHSEKWTRYNIITLTSLFLSTVAM